MFGSTILTALGSTIIRAWLGKGYLDRDNQFLEVER